MASSGTRVSSGARELSQETIFLLRFPYDCDVGQRQEGTNDVKSQLTASAHRVLKLASSAFIGLICLPELNPTGSYSYCGGGETLERLKNNNTSRNGSLSPLKPTTQSDSSLAY